MAVYTKVSNPDITQFLSHYYIGELVSLTEIAEGVENSNYILKTTNGTFILTLYEKRVNPAELPFFMNLTDYLADKGLPVPRPIKNKQGETLGDLCGRKCAIVEFLNGKDLKILTSDACYQVGQWLAKLHTVGMQCPHSRPNSMGQKTWADLYAQCDSTATAQFNPALPDLIRAELDYLDTAWNSLDLPTGIIHADLFPDNVFFTDGKFSGFIDFYFACNDVLLYDLAICLNAWCFEDHSCMNVTKASRILQGYNSVRPISDAEKQAFNTLLRGGAMRFLLSRLYDWVNTPEDALVQRKGPTEYVQKLKFHQGMESFNAYGFVV